MGMPRSYRSSRWSVNRLRLGLGLGSGPGLSHEQELGPRLEAWLVLELELELGLVIW